MFKHLRKHVKKGQPSQEHQLEMARLNKCIYDCHCPTCQAKPGDYCIQQTRHPIPGVMDQTTTKSPHMARVREGHKLMKVRHNPNL